MNTKNLEVIMRGVGNHRRIQIMALLARMPRLSVFAIADELDVNFKTISEHLRRLTVAGLVKKQHKGPAVEHSLSLLGNNVLMFLRTLEHQMKKMTEIKHITVKNKK